MFTRVLPAGQRWSQPGGISVQTGQPAAINQRNKIGSISQGAAFGSIWRSISHYKAGKYRSLPRGSRVLFHSLSVLRRVATREWGPHASCSCGPCTLVAESRCADLEAQWMTQTAFGDLGLVEAGSWQRLRNKPLASESPGSLNLACHISGLTPWRGLTHLAL